MSNNATNWAYSLEIDTSPKATLLAMANCHNAQTGRCDPSVEYLAQLTGKSVRTTKRNIRWLIDRKLVEQTRGRRVAASYKLDCESVAEPEPVAADPAEGQNGTFLEVPKADQNGTSCQSRGAKTDNQEVPKRAPYIDNRNIEPEEKKEYKRTRSKSAVDIDGFRAVFDGILPAETVDGLIDTRKAKRGAITPLAAKLLLERLRQFPDPEAVAKTMIVRGWIFVAPEWLENRRTQQGRGQSGIERPPDEMGNFLLGRMAQRRTTGGLDS